MASHHRGCGPSIRHAWCKLIDTVPAGRIAHDVNSVWIDGFKDDHILNQPVKEFVDVRLMPQVPRIGRSSGYDIDTFVQFVELLLILPLLVVNFAGRTASPVH